MANNKSMLKAKNNDEITKDEYYTRYEYIEEVLEWYGKANYFFGKKILLPSDITYDDSLDDIDKKKSNFSKYLIDNKKKFGIESITTSFWDATLTKEENISRGNEKFQNINFDEYDIIITNPPGSIAIDLFNKIISNDKKFIIVIDFKKVVNKDIYKKIEEVKVWFNHTKPGMKMDKLIINEDGSREVIEKNQGTMAWLTNIGPVSESSQNEFTGKTYYGNEEEYPFIDGTEVISIDKVKLIPDDYEGVMAVPTSIIYNFNYDVFEIVGISEGYSMGNAYLNKRKKNTRIFIKRKRSVS